MAHKVLYFDEVKQDIKEAKHCYRNQSKGLEKRFAEDIKTAIARLQERPDVHESVIGIFELRILMFFLTPFIFI